MSPYIPDRYRTAASLAEALDDAEHQGNYIDTFYDGEEDENEDVVELLRAIHLLSGSLKVVSALSLSRNGRQPEDRADPRAHRVLCHTSALR